MTKSQKIVELIEANPKAEQQAEQIEEAMLLVRQLRQMGMMPKQYELATPFGDKVPLRPLRASIPRRSD